VIIRRNIYNKWGKLKIKGKKGIKCNFKKGGK
jgi:hypothetical protein